MPTLDSFKPRRKRDEPAPHSSEDRLLVGVIAMAKEAGVAQRKMYHWLTLGLVSSAGKVGGQWTAGRNRFRREFGLD
jgi:hypothetical protein